MCDWFIENMFRFCIHEYGHYLQGGNDQHVGYGFWGLLSGWGVKSYVANAFERYRLGWINLNTVQSSPNQTISNATLPDFVTTGVAYRLVINDSSKQYIYIENHQSQSIWETTKAAYPNRTIENGIYVLRQDGVGGDDKFIRCLAADGRYNWTVNQRIQSPWGPEMLPVFKMLNPDRVNGYTDLDWIPWWWNGIYQGEAAIHFIEDANGNLVMDIPNMGDGTDAFRMEYNQMFSPYSNPNSQRANKTATPFGFNINGFTNGVASLDIYVGTSLTGPPSKPQFLKVAWYNNHPKLTWDTNGETDMQSYKIWKYAAGSSMIAATITHNAGYTTQSWIDNSVTMPGKFDPQIEYIYKVKAVDNTNKESVYSNQVSIIGTGGIWKIGEDQNSVVINEYKLFSNYPNPFNPSTVINYAVKEAGLVKIKVFDILGSEVAELVNETKELGYHSVEFNASNLPSGVYIYTLQVNGFSASQKMLLLK